MKDEKKPVVQRRGEDEGVPGRKISKYKRHKVWKRGWWGWEVAQDEARELGKGQTTWSS